MIAGTPCDRRRHCALRNRYLKHYPKELSSGHSLSPSRCGTAECWVLRTRCANAHAKGERRKSCGQAAPTRSVPEGLTDTLRVCLAARFALTLKFKIRSFKVCPKPTAHWVLSPSGTAKPNGHATRTWTGTLREQKKKDMLQAPNARYGKCKKIFSQRVGAPEKGVLVSSP